MIELTGDQNFQTEFNIDTVSSRDILIIYRNVYSLAKKLREPVWTEAIYRCLHLQFTNPGIPRNGLAKRQYLSFLSGKIDLHYETLFRELQYSQENKNDLD